MENASKALIIAGAVLISILIIGLAVFLYNQASGTVNRGNLNSQEAQAQNQPFEAYFGDKVSASDVKQLMSLVRTNNITGQTGNETKKIFVYLKGGSGTFKSGSFGDPATISKDVVPGKTYNVGVANSKVSDDEDSASESDTPTLKEGIDKTGAYYKSGYIKIIKITENN